MAKELSKSIIESKSSRIIESRLELMNLLFIIHANDVPLFCYETIEGIIFKDILQLYNNAMGLEINIHKSDVVLIKLIRRLLMFLGLLIPFRLIYFQDGLKYPSFNFKPNGYDKRFGYG